MIERRNDNCSGIIKNAGTVPGKDKDTDNHVLQINSEERREETYQERERRCDQLGQKAERDDPSSAGDYVSGVERQRPRQTAADDRGE